MTTTQINLFIGINKIKAAGESVKMNIKLKVNRKRLMNWLILIPLLYPKGFAEYSSAYKRFFTLWLYMAVLCILVIATDKAIKGRLKINKRCKEVLLYYAAMIVMTFLIRMSFLDGLQKMFVAPMLAVFMYVELKTNPVDFIKSVNGVLMCSFILGLTIFNPIFWPSMFDPENNHLFFWGHVQVGAQLGLLSIIFSYAEYKLFRKCKKKKFIFSVVLAVCVMLMSATSMSYMIIAVLLIYTLLYEKIQLKWKGKKYVTLYVVMNVLLFFVIAKLGPALNIGGLSLNGRGFIWEKAIENFLKSPIWGYGVHGTLIQVFWSKWNGDGSGMNYMHNQLLQVANDGGLILLVLYVLMIYTVMDSIDRISNKKIQKRCVGFMLAVLVVMSFESGLEYVYLLMALILLGEIKNLIVRRMIPQ